MCGCVRVCNTLIFGRANAVMGVMALIVFFVPHVHHVFAQCGSSLSISLSLSLSISHTHTHTSTRVYFSFLYIYIFLELERVSGFVERVVHEYNQGSFDALLKCVRSSLELIKSRDALFKADVELQIPNVAMTPSMGEIQRALARTSDTIQAACRNICTWGQVCVCEFM